MSRILYVTADPKEHARVRRYWRSDPDVELVTSGREAIKIAREHPPDVTCVDVTSLRGDPRRFLVRLRRAAPGQAILLIIGGDEPREALPPADAYVRKPFNKRIFRQRVKAALKKRAQDVLSVGPFRLDKRTRTLSGPYRTVHLTPREMTLMELFMQHPGETLTREELLRAIWKAAYTENMRVLDVHIHWLRVKVEADPKIPVYIQTRYGKGYTFDPGDLPEDDDGSG